MRNAYLVLLPAGFTMPRLLPAARCALTAPFHLFLTRKQGSLFSVALSIEALKAPSGHYPAPFFREARTFLSAQKHAAAIRFFSSSNSAFYKQKLQVLVFR